MNSQNAIIFAGTRNELPASFINLRPLFEKHPAQPPCGEFLALFPFTEIAPGFHWWRTLLFPFDPNPDQQQLPATRFAPAAGLSCDQAPLRAVPSPWEAAMLRQTRFNESQSSHELSATAIGVHTLNFEDFVFDHGLEQYLHSKGTAQRTQRKVLSGSLSRSEVFEKQITKVLSSVAESPSQDVMAAAIDLLAALGTKFGDYALKVAFAEIIQNDNVAFIVAAAAGRNGTLLPRMLLQSQHRPIREGVIEALATRDTLEAKTLLRQTAFEDESPSLRDRARAVLEDIS